MKALLAVLVGYVVSILKMLFFSYREREIDRKLKEKKDELEKVSTEFHESYADFKRKLEKYRAAGDMQQPLGGVRKEPGEGG